MAAFKDKQGREWKPELTIGTLTDAKRAGIPLDEVLVADDTKAVQELVYGRKSIQQFVNLLFIMCADQAKEREVSDEDFGRLLDFAALAGARAAVMEAVAFFTHPPETAARMQVALARAMATADTAAAAEIEERLPAMLEIVKAKAAELVASESATSNATSGNSPESPESPTPGR